MKPKSLHWADQTASRIVGVLGEQKSYTVASGITPSGVVHIGNFREVITVHLVAKALQDMGKKVRFVYSWDNFDTFRKVPKNLPNQEMLATHLRRPICRVPDPHGTLQSYAAHNMNEFEKELQAVGIFPEYLNQEKKYADGRYAKAIRKALENTDKIREILNRHKTTPLPKSWVPTAVYCEKCDRDEILWQKYDGGWNYSYACASSDCANQATIDIRDTKHLKLNWRTDWPMRWDHEKVDFEPGGKDHSSDGGSFDTAKVIVRDIWQRTPPQYLQYDFVAIKGGAGKMSSSSGELLTLSQAMDVYDPLIIRWIFATQRPNHDFTIALDVDVIKTYDEFDRAEALACSPQPEKPGRWPLIKRTYELALADKFTGILPYRPPFRELCNRLQICDGDIKRTMEKFYSEAAVTEDDISSLKQRAKCALFWLANYAPSEFCYTLNEMAPGNGLSQEQEKAIQALRTLVENIDLSAIDPKELNQAIYDSVIRGTGIEGKDFFTTIYQRLISRDQGPRLPGFLKEIGKEKLLCLLS